MDAMAHADDAAEPLQIDVQQIADVRPLVPLDRRGRLQQRQAIQTGAREHPSDRRSGHAATPC